ncbi:nucleotidyltransferase domain-containing protein [Persephonella sp.]
MKTVKNNYNQLLRKVKQIKSIDDLRSFLREYFKNKNVKIYLFGSRAKGKQSIYSDIDLAFESENDITKDLTLIRELLEESYLPYKLDIIDLSKTPHIKKP